MEQWPRLCVGRSTTLDHMRVPHNNQSWPPLPQRHGLDPARVRTPDRDPACPAPWTTMQSWLSQKLGEFIDVDEFIREQRFVYASGEAVQSGDAYRQSTPIWFHRDLPDETPVPGDMPIVYRDDRIIVIDKPPFLSSIPRGKHILESAVVKLRAQVDLPELTPAHRLDRVTSGLLLFTTERRWRGAYQTVFQQRIAHKVYHALAATDESRTWPVTVKNHLVKHEGTHRVQVIDDAPANAISTIDVQRVLGESSIYRLTPLTGKTHQLRQHMLSLGLPIQGDPLYPVERAVALDDFTDPLQLLAAELSFTDPVDGSTRHFRSSRSLPIEGYE